MHELIYDIIMLCAINGNVLSSPTHSFSLAFRLRFYENYMARTERITMYYHAVHFCRPLCSAIVCGKDRRKERREKEREKRIKRILLKLWMILLSLDSTVISLQIIMSRGSAFFTPDLSILPADLPELKDKAFYELVKELTSSDEAELLELQSIRSVHTFMRVNPLNIFHLDSNDLVPLQSRLAHKRADGKYVVHVACWYSWQYDLPDQTLQFIQKTKDQRGTNKSQ